MCKIFGHKFKYGFLGSIFRKPIGAFDETDYCVRCGIDRNYFKDLTKPTKMEKTINFYTKEGELTRDIEKADYVIEQRMMTLDELKKEYPLYKITN